MSDEYSSCQLSIIFWRICLQTFESSLRIFRIKRFLVVRVTVIRCFVFFFRNIFYFVECGTIQHWIPREFIILKFLLDVEIDALFFNSLLKIKEHFQIWCGVTFMNQLGLVNNTRFDCNQVQTSFNFQQILWRLVY